MESSFGRALKAARALARNPLGIIALFIVLVYGIAGIVFGIAVGNLEWLERLVLCAFLVLFPVAVLLVFYRLVTRHYWKLYAPSDYGQPETFLEVLSLTEQKRRLDQEVDEIADEEAPKTDSEKAADGSIGSVTETPLRLRLILAADVALREVGSEAGSVVHRNMRAVASDGQRVELDGVATIHGRQAAIEVKLIRPKSWPRALINAVLHSKRVVEDLGLDVVIALVCDGLSEEQTAEMQSRLDEELERYHLRHAVGYRVYDLQTLEAKYGL